MREFKPKPSDEWETPPDLFMQLDDEFHFDADLASSPLNQKCRWGTDALFNEPGEFICYRSEACFMNPPYSNPYPFIKRALELQKNYKFTLVMLLKLDPTTKWWKLFPENSEIRLLPKRLRFYMNGVPGKHVANFPCAVVVVR